MRFKLTQIMIAVLALLAGAMWCAQVEARPRKRIVQIHLGEPAKSSAKKRGPASINDKSKSSSKAVAYVDKKAAKKKIVLIDGAHTAVSGDAHFDAVPTKPAKRVTGTTKKPKTYCEIEAVDPKIILTQPAAAATRAPASLNEPVDEKALLIKFRKATEAEVSDEYL